MGRDVVVVVVFCSNARDSQSSKQARKIIQQMNTSRKIRRKSSIGILIVFGFHRRTEHFSIPLENPKGNQNENEKFNKMANSINGDKVKVIHIYLSTFFHVHINIFSISQFTPLFHFRCFVFFCPSLCFTLLSDSLYVVALCAVSLFFVVVVVVFFASIFIILYTFAITELVLFCNWLSSDNSRFSV